MPEPKRPRVLLMGGGHSHLIAAPLLAQTCGDRAAIALVAPSAQLLYSGMMPGWLAGLYTFDDCAIDLAQICADQGIEWIEDEVIDIDCAAREAIGLRARYPFDLASVNVGSANDPGEVRANAPLVLGTKPFAQFVASWDAWRSRALERPGPRSMLVIGGGPAAVEIAFALAAWVRAHASLAGSTVTLATVGEGVLDGIASIAARLARASLVTRGIELRFGCRYTGAADGNALFDGGVRIAADLVIVANGAKPPTWLAATASRGGIALAPDNGLAIRSDLRSTSHAALFACGDCATFVDQRVPKSGVHALRQGPVLAYNLAGSLTAAGAPQVPRRFVARRWTLALLNRCDGSAIGAWGPLGFAGRWAWRWKDRIDRRFMGRFR